MEKVGCGVGATNVLGLRRTNRQIAGIDRPHYEHYLAPLIAVKLGLIGVNYNQPGYSRILVMCQKNGILNTRKPNVQKYAVLNS